MVIIVFGVSGVGKTTVGRMLAEELGWAFYDADDFHTAANVEKMRGGTPLSDEDRRDWLTSLRRLIEEKIAKNEGAVLACSALKRTYREYLSVGDAVGFVYLKGEFDVIAKRLSERPPHFMPGSLLPTQFEHLEEPGVEALTLDAHQPPAKLVAEIVQWMRTIDRSTAPDRS